MPMPVTLHALLARRPDLTHDQFLVYWHRTHGPLIRDTPALARHIVTYTQHPLTPSAAELGLDRFDGITVQTFADWEAFRAFVFEPDAATMNADMANFLDVDALQVTVTEAPLEVIAP